ncbi:hypothetical protein ABOM_000509 [Aspergillus bombycis]|uniref:Uncharacterized protein n=1 Tax=Aspergillus bombycis TaxID=109264 RepID=A0A1F8AGT1_9EURO|nr:hypothetical protein ABOM_000509 [Aspergillus bombycis]OGM50960.1 hypothetical protein ABOM_000509 [Aspergillus bombycis]
MSGSLETLAKPSAFFVRQVSRTSTNARIPPIARRSASPLPCRMAVLSRDKLEREAAAKNPDLRRCLGHQRLLRRSIEAAQEDARKAMASFRLEESDEDEIFEEDFEAPPSPMIREQITKAVKAMVKRRAASQAHETDNGNAAAPQLMRVSSKNDSSCDLSARPPNAFYKTPSVTTKRRKPTTRFTLTRLLWSSSSQPVQTMAS